MSSNKVVAKWLSGIESPDEFEKKLLEQKILFKRLYNILLEKQDANYKSSIKKTNYEKIAWSEFQADAIGYARCLEEIKVLLNFTQEE